ncbi:TIGR04104 family putative zinc finger protein [Solibacillus sp. NPDC093137]|uniref:TIGR04104 family putative zinc finger protein n=1 Tax=Solibacillus sp. NPDC093137 TaxID=3390678 RepID=UPI003D064680
MQKCIKCNSQFGWRKIFQSYKWTYGPLECDNCGSIHKIAIFGRFTVAFLTMLPFLIVQFFLIPSDNVFLTIGGSGLMATVCFLLSPFVVRYKERL